MQNQHIYINLGKSYVWTLINVASSLFLQYTLYMYYQAQDLQELEQRL